MGHTVERKVGVECDIGHLDATTEVTDQMVPDEAAAAGVGDIGYTVQRTA